MSGPNPQQVTITSYPQPREQAPLMPTHTTTTVVAAGVPPPGGCPVCHNRHWTGTYSCLAWLSCIFCFPCGIICCLCMRKKKCTKCGFTIG